jgi:hypothetical protein
MGLITETSTKGKLGEPSLVLRSLIDPVPNADLRRKSIHLGPFYEACRSPPVPVLRRCLLHAANRGWSGAISPRI